MNQHHQNKDKKQQRRREKIVSFTSDDENLVHEIPRLSLSRYDDCFYDDDEIAIFRYNAFLIMAGVFEEEEEEDDEKLHDSSNDNDKFTAIDQSNSNIETVMSDLSASSLPSHDDSMTTTDENRRQVYKQIVGEDDDGGTQPIHAYAD